MRRVIIPLLLLFLLFAGLFSAVRAQTDSDPGQIIVKLAPETAVTGVNADYGTETVRAMPYDPQIYLLHPGNRDASQIAADMAGDGRLQYVELNQASEAPEANTRDIYAWPDEKASSDDTTTTESETTYNPRELYEWELGVNDVARYVNQSASHDIRLTQSRSVNWGGGMVVAVLDTGIDRDHPLLEARIAPEQYDFVDDDAIAEDEFNGLDDDGDGYVDEVAGHGTHVAGLVTLVAPEAAVMPLRVLDSDGRGDTFVLAEAMLYAAAHGADVISLSLGTTTPSALLADVTQQVVAQGVLVVAAAGNLNQDVPQYPAAGDCALAVTALDGKKRADFANYGAWVDIAAPGEHVNSTYPDGTFAYWNGTSMAAPLVAGQAAVIRSVDGSLTPADVAQLIAGTAVSVDNVNNGYEGMLGAGLIDVDTSLRYVHNGILPPVASPLQSCSQ